MFWDLPYWDSFLIRHVLDVMCIEKNVFDTIFMLLAAKGKQNEDDIKSRKDLAM